ncbi:MAG TPA: class I SAM-dependent methyltransferase [Ktedonobacteraceae bacterium]|nr:class I SAM-dependent methyltransferase [Ktedonobacteraceae bacterium]
MSESVRAVHVSTQEGYARWATTYDQEDNALIVLEEATVNLLLTQISYKRVLDVGTGTGRYALKLAQRGASITALDQSPEMLAVARQAAQRQKLPIDFQLAPLDHTLPFVAAQFDLLVCALTLCHVPDLTHTIAEFARVLQPGGHLLITDFHPDSISYGWRTQFQQTGVKYLLPNMLHTRNTYLDALKMNGLTTLQAMDLPLQALPVGYFSEEFLRANGERFFCLVLLAQKV